MSLSFFLAAILFLMLMIQHGNKYQELQPSAMKQFSRLKVRNMRVKVLVKPVVLTRIMNFAADVTVISPESVKDELTALASDVLAQYK